MKKKIALVVGMLILCTAFLAACGGMPGYLSSPPEDPAELVTKLEQDDWVILDDGSMSGGIMAMRTNMDLDAEEIDENETVKMEMAIVYYCESEFEAEMMVGVMEPVCKLAKEEAANENVNFSYKVTQKGTIVVIYMSMSGKAGDMGDAGDIMPM